MNTDYKTMIMLLPTSNKRKTYEELRNAIRGLLGSVYENKANKNDIDNAISTTPINCMTYDRQLDSKETEAIKTMCNKYGVVVLFFEGTKVAFDNIERATITLEVE